MISEERQRLLILPSQHSSEPPASQLDLLQKLETRKKSPKKQREH